MDPIKLISETIERHDSVLASSDLHVSISKLGVSDTGDEPEAIIHFVGTDDDVVSVAVISLADMTAPHIEQAVAEAV